MNKIKIAIPTLRRPKDCNLSLFSNEFFDIHLFVSDQKDFEDYSNLYPNIRIINCGIFGIANVRNSILDFFKDDNEIIMTEDDVISISKLDMSNKKVLHNLPSEELYYVIKDFFNILCKEELYLWGVYPVPNYFFMKEQKSRFHFVIGTFCGIRISNLRYDIDCKLKEDYDFTLQNIMKYGGVLRFDDYCVKSKHYTNKGGCYDCRKENDKIACDYLLNKYPNFIKMNPRRQNEILLDNDKLKNKFDKKNIYNYW